MVGAAGTQVWQRHGEFMLSGHLSPWGKTEFAQDVQPAPVLTHISLDVDPLMMEKSV